MSRFVRLTFEGKPILINAGHVLSVEPFEDGSRVQMSVHPGALDVAESFDAVCDLLIMSTNEVEQ